MASSLDRNFHASNWLFAQTTHVDIHCRPLKFCKLGRVREVVIRFKFHENRSRACVVTVRRLNRYELIQIRRLSSIANFVSERDDFIFNSFGNFKPVKSSQNSSDVLEFWSLDNSSSKSILDVLETIC